MQLSLILAESHNDTIAELQLHPLNPRLLLSGSTDGLVNVFDLIHRNEEDALRQTENHVSAIHHAGFIDSSRTGWSIYALGTDETLSLFSMGSVGIPDETVAGPALRAMGDVRKKLGCEYAVKLGAGVAGAPYLAVGDHRYV